MKKFLLNSKMKVLRILSVFAFGALAMGITNVQTTGTFTRISLVSNYDQLKFEAPGENRYWIMSKTTGVHNKAFALYSPEDGGYFTHWEAGSGNMIINKGSLGIGTTNPTALLTVNGDIKITSEKHIKFGQSYSKIYENGLDQLVVQGHNGSVFQSYNGASSTLFTDLFMRYGKVGIGTTNPDSELTVKGTIHAEEVKVDLSVPGPDYVFEEDYDLPSLESIQDYIRENKHLPEVPSAAEMEEKGIDLGVMNMLLLKKVEELTLYQIELLSVVKDQNQRIKTLENRLK